MSNQLGINPAINDQVSDQASLVVGVVHEEGAALPSYATKGASGADVRAHLESPYTIAPGQVAVIPTGLKLEIPQGYEIQVRSRSGLAAKFGVATLNSPGTIDWDYKGELKVILINHGSEPFVVEPGMRIAQLVIAPVLQASFESATELSQSARGSGGFGHTGLQ